MISHRTKPFCGPADSFDHPEVIAALRGTLLPYEEGSGECCYLCFIPRGAVAPEPWEVTITDVVSRLIVVLEDTAKTSLYVRLIPEGDRARHTTEIFVRDDAQLDLLFFQESRSSSLVLRQRSSIGTQSMLSLRNVSLGSGTLEHTLLCDVNGVRSESSVDWLFYSKGREAQRIDAQNVFHAREGRGEMTMRGVAEDTAHAVCMGMIKIDPDGGGTDTYLTEDVLMLDPTAKVDAVPGLEIRTNDVKASHSATVSKVTRDDLFYFASRGIAEGAAREMYILGFLGSITQRIVRPKEKTAVLEAIEKKYRALELGIKN